jgi:hypothetical protein
MTAHSPLTRVPVSAEVQRELTAFIRRHGKMRALKLLACSPFTLDDAIAPGASLVPKTLDRLLQKMREVPP